MAGGVRLDLHDIGRHHAVEQPGEAHPELGGEARQERQIEAAPQEPGERARQLDAIDVGDRLAHAERGERALRGVGEGLELLAVDLGEDVGGELPPFAHGELRRLRARNAGGSSPGSSTSGISAASPSAQTPSWPGTRMKRSVLMRPQCMSRPSVSTSRCGPLPIVATMVEVGMMRPSVSSTAGAGRRLGADARSAPRCREFASGRVA